jgi:HlyD family secretion protein
MAEATNGSFYGRHRVLVWMVCLAVSVLLLASFMSRDNSIPVRAATVERGTIQSVISTNGKLEPVQDFQAHAPIGTTVKKVWVHEGDQVKQGQLMLELDDADARSEVAKALAGVRAAQADLSAIEHGGNREAVLTVQSELTKAQAERDAAKRNLDALQRLQQKGAASPGEVKSAQDRLNAAVSDVNLLQQKQKSRYSQPEVSSVQAQKQQAEAAYTAAQDVLSKLNIRAPFDGIVYSVPVKQGAYVNPGDPVIQEADFSKVLVRAFVDEPDLGRLAPGQKIELTWDAVPGRVWTGAVSAVPSEIKLHGTRNVGEITSIVSNGDFKLLPNVNVGVSIITAEHSNVLTVPREAIRQDDETTFVYQINPNSELQRRDIQTLLSNLTKVEVTGGISEHASVALTAAGSKPLKEGTPVKVIH